MSKTKRSIMEENGKRLKSHREKKGISKYRLAKDEQIRAEQIDAIESGNDVYLSTFVSYCNGIGVKIFNE